MAGARAIDLRTAQPAYTTSGTPAGGLDLEVVYVGLGTDADFAGRDVAGKAALITSMPMRSTLRHSATVNGAVRRADALGAAAILVSVALPGNIRTQFYPTRTEAPTFSLGQQDGAALRALRRDIAKENQIPPYVIFHDSVLRDMAGLRPQTRALLGELPGIGAKKLEAYGDAFLEVIRQHER